jgi:hypothetical protein
MTRPHGHWSFVNKTVHAGFFSIKLKIFFHFAVHIYSFCTEVQISFPIDLVLVFAIENVPTCPFSPDRPRLRNRKQDRPLLGAATGLSVVLTKVKSYARTAAGRIGFFTCTQLLRTWFSGISSPRIRFSPIYFPALFYYDGVAPSTAL